MYRKNERDCKINSVIVIHLLNLCLIFALTFYKFKYGLYGDMNSF